jgi:hypothetical protein
MAAKLNYISQTKLYSVQFLFSLVCLFYEYNLLYKKMECTHTYFICFYHGVHTVIAWSTGFMQLPYSYISTFTVRSMLSSSEFAESNTLALLIKIAPKITLESGGFPIIKVHRILTESVIANKEIITTNKKYHFIVFYDIYMYRYVFQYFLEEHVRPREI